MKVRIVEVEGTPDELAELPFVADALRIATTSPGGSDSRMSLDTDVAAFISQEAPISSRDLVIRLASEFASWEGVEATCKSPNSPSGGGSGYVRFNRRPQYVGAFAYLVPARLQLKLRLPVDASASAVYASSRAVKPQDPYQILIQVREETFEEAVQLARRAYERAAENGTSRRERGVADD